MDLTFSFGKVVPTSTLERYRWLETRNAAAVFKASNPELFQQLLDVLAGFYVFDDDILVPGGNRGPIPIRLDTAFAKLGWSAVRVNTEIRLVGKRKTNHLNRGYDAKYMETMVKNEGFEVDNMKGRVALDVEWNAKDGNLDRDLSAYRSLYDFGLIDVACMITRDHQGIRDLAATDLHSSDAYRRLGTSTTTNLEKLQPRLTRGDGGGCPVLAVGITRSTWAGNGGVGSKPRRPPATDEGRIDIVGDIAFTDVDLYVPRDVPDSIAVNLDETD